MEHHPLSIPQRLTEIDPDLRVLYDTEEQRYEVWGRDIRGPYLVTRYAKLHAGLLEDLRQAYRVASSTGRPYKHMLHEQREHNARLERGHRRELADVCRCLREDMAGLSRQLWPGWGV